MSRGLTAEQPVDGRIPDDWTCPDCGVREKIDFTPLSEEPA